VAFRRCCPPLSAPTLHRLSPLVVLLQHAADEEAEKVHSVDNGYFTWVGTDDCRIDPLWQGVWFLQRVAKRAAPGW
jgi:hypothetical protein